MHVDLIAGHELANCNTAAAFVNETVKYGIVRHVPGSQGWRYRPIEPSPMTLAVFSHWLATHLMMLDGLDSATRSAALHAKPAMLGAIQPLIADGLLASRAVREPNRTFSLFTWGIVKDRLIVGCWQDSAALARIPTDMTSVSALARRLNLSRSQLGRKFDGQPRQVRRSWQIRVAGVGGILARVSRRKLAITDVAFGACCTRGRAGMVSIMTDTASPDRAKARGWPRWLAHRCELWRCGLGTIANEARCPSVVFRL